MAVYLTLWVSPKPFNLIIDINLRLLRRIHIIYGISVYYMWSLEADSRIHIYNIIIIYFTWTY